MDSQGSIGKLLLNSLSNRELNFEQNQPKSILKHFEIIDQIYEDEIKNWHKKPAKKESKFDKLKEKVKEQAIIERRTKFNDGRYKPYWKIIRPSKNKEKAVKYFEDPLAIYFHKKGDFMNPKIKIDEPYKRTASYQKYLTNIA